MAKSGRNQHGVALVERVIEHVRSEGLAALGSAGLPRGARPKGVSAARLDGLRLPGDRALSPSLAAWLAFDASWLGWPGPRQRKIRGQSLGDWAAEQYGFDYGFSTVESTLDAPVLPLHHGADSRRCLYLGVTDRHGEYPVLLTDTDDAPYLGVEYPGIDVYLAALVGLVEPPRAEYGAFADHRVYGPRMKQHARKLFGGPIGIDVDAQPPPETAKPGPKKAAGSKDEPMVEVIRGRNPMTGGVVTEWIPRSAVRPGDRLVDG